MSLVLYFILIWLLINIYIVGEGVTVTVGVASISLETVLTATMRFTMEVR